MNRIATVVAGLSLAFVGTSATIAGTINVPGDQPTIAAAISASVNGDVINIAAGTYNEHSLNPNGKAITIQGTLDGNGALLTTIDAQQNGRVFKIDSGEGNGTVIKELEIVGGSIGEGGGGGIYCYLSSPTITGCTIADNTSNGESSRGGGIYCKTQSNPTITNCSITDNSARFGGGIHFQNSFESLISGCIISNNTTESNGAGIGGENSSLNIIDCTISGNTSHDDGGGIWLQGWESTNSSITSCTISNNSSDWNGGGICCAQNGNATISDCLISSNTAPNGSGIYILTDGSSVSTSLICGNTPNQVEVAVGSYIDGGNILTTECTLLGEPNGGCCLGEACITATESNCTAAGGTYAGDLATCADADCASSGCPPTDVNQSGQVNIDDLLLVIEDWGDTCTP